jgi:hypothetical protein
MVKTRENPENVLLFFFNLLVLSAGNRGRVLAGVAVSGRNTYQTIGSDVGRVIFTSSPEGMIR